MTHSDFDQDFNDVLDPKVESQLIEPMAHEFRTYQKPKAGEFKIIPVKPIKNSIS